MPGAVVSGRTGPSSSGEIVDGLLCVAGRSSLEEARRVLPKLAMAGADLLPFTEFAVQVCGLMRREAHAIFTKMEFWQVRSGVDPL